MSILQFEVLLIQGIIIIKTGIRNKRFSSFFNFNKGNKQNKKIFYANSSSSSFEL